MTSRSKRPSVGMISPVTSSGRISKERHSSKKSEKSGKYLCQAAGCTTELHFSLELQQLGEPCHANPVCGAGLCGECVKKTVCKECSEDYFRCPSCHQPELWNDPQGQCDECKEPLCHICAGEEGFCPKCSESTTFCSHCQLKFFVKEEDFDSSKDYRCQECSTIHL